MKFAWEKAEAFKHIRGCVSGVNSLACDWGMPTSPNSWANSKKNNGNCLRDGSKTNVWRWLGFYPFHFSAPSITSSKTILSPHMAQDLWKGKSWYLGYTDDPFIEEVLLPVMNATSRHLQHWKHGELRRLRHSTDTESAAAGHIWLSLLFICILRNHRVTVVPHSDSPWSEQHEDQQAADERCKMEARTGYKTCSTVLLPKWKKPNNDFCVSEEWQTGLKTGLRLRFKMTTTTFKVQHATPLTHLDWFSCRALRET